MKFELSNEQQQLTDSLSEIIREEIGNSYIPFSKFMNLALYHPQYGYYNNLLYKFGSSGDFITAPLLSELFGLGLCRQIDEILKRITTPYILEFGAGNGQLMLDLLCNLRGRIGHYYIVELSTSLAQLQKQRLRDELPEFINSVTWLTALPKEFKGIIIGNEVIDAIACDIVHWYNGKIYSKAVIHKDGRFSFTDIKASEQILQLAKNIHWPAFDYIAEVSKERIGFIRSLSEVLKEGVILLIDYGYGETEYYSPARSGGTLRGFFRQHQLDDVLQFPGLIDITSNVDFTSIAKAAVNDGLDLLGFTTQAVFLVNCGIIDELEKKQAKCSEREYLQLTNQLNRLISPNEMGEIFKVIGFSKNLDYSDYIGFKNGDRTYTL